MPFGSNKQAKDTVGKGGYGTKQRHTGVLSRSTEAAGGFGSRPSGAGAPVNSFTGRNPNI